MVALLQKDSSTATPATLKDISTKRTSILHVDSEADMMSEDRTHQLASVSLSLDSEGSSIVTQN